MICKKVVYRSFRNIEYTEFYPDPHVSIIYGENAHGKTNLLEGIYLLSQGRSFRTPRDSDMVRFGEPVGQISLSYDTEERKGRTISMTIGSLASPGRVIEADGVKIKKSSEMLGRFRSVLFTPMHLELVNGSPDGRRSFLDMAMCQLSSEYTQDLQQYNHYLTQRNAYLKARFKQDGLSARYDEMADVYTHPLAVIGAKIAKQRFSYTCRLSEYVGMIYTDMVGTREEPSVEYMDEFEEHRLYEKLKAGFANDIRRGFTGHGPHRADLYLSVNSASMRGIASQGQMRTMALALKIAEGEVSRERTGEYPVFLFDDVFSELDKSRRSYLFGERIGGQVIITCCVDPPTFEGMFYRMTNGYVTGGANHE